MLFDSEPYLIFLPAVVAINWLIPSRFRPGFLLLVSYVFYASWTPAYLLLILLLTAFNYQVGLIQGRRLPRSRRLLLLAVVGNLAVLGTFKYLGWLDSSALNAAHLLGLHWSPPLIQLVLPIGLSFFTFEFLHYQFDLYRGTEPITHPIRFALFPAFFPTQIAGPIKRYEDFDEQVRERPAFSSPLFLEGIELVALGLFKKIAIADGVARIALLVALSPNHLTWTDAWIGALAFYVQIYFDFSGYTDIARGSAQLLGYRIPINFNAPFLASGLLQGWQRWHMSLTFWFRDYVFSPLASSRREGWIRGRPRLVLALMTTTVLVGLWHGAGGGYLLWGFVMGLLMLIDRVLQVRVWRRLKRKRLAFYGRWLQTAVFVVISMPPFFAGLRGALRIWQGMILGGPHFGVVSPLDGLEVVGIYLATIAIQVAVRRWKPREALASLDLSSLLRPAYVAGLATLAIYFAVTNLPGVTPARGFIYFQF
ncbi:MAG: MBOAT family protein [Actinobacteria bacterium]|nr:MBOAT family protein [Actinomycetota bacterium]